MGRKVGKIIKLFQWVLPPIRRNLLKFLMSRCLACVLARSHTKAKGSAAAACLAKKRRSPLT